MIIKIDTASATPIYEQLREKIIYGVASGALGPGEALPSARRLAADLGVNLHTVGKAYATLTDEGIIAMDRRRGAVISKTAPADKDFYDALNKRIGLTAAEAICRGVGYEEFAAICAKSYRVNGRVNNSAEKGDKNANERA